ncbi:pilus assembly protein TadG-related protein [Nocardioides sp. TRM66260-LWL]|uniref:pilus assembly protein TadG-related protein n=1 Tax=Nocardioides sp. TRM66260-LWL TaxID=2874478 RepID=UPI001CC57B32|nr:pilus assembly protein TadG-related protein [Nocardioides sp. TRM66260-LWL]MBZ5733173.1 pilus assembly protein TadG-related protein [Nocardioides sp. TRM66260-LWL]
MRRLQALRTLLTLLVPLVRPTRRDERGAIIPIVATLLVVLVGSTAFAVDLGRQRVARSDMQALADVVSLDIARLLAGQTSAALLGDATFKAAIVSSVSRNTATIGDPPTVKVEIGQYAGGVFTPSGSVSYTAGGATVGSISITTAEDIPSATRVTAGTRLAFAFAPGTGAANRSSVAVTDSSACFQIGTYAAAVRSGSSTLLNPLLSAINSNLNLTAAGYSGLASTAIDLSDLAVALGVGTVDQLATTTVSYRSFYLALAQVLTKNGQTANVTLLNTLAASVSSTATFAIGSLLALGTGSNAAVSASTNLLDLVAGSAFLINGSNLVSLPVSTSLPGLATATAQVKVIQNIMKYCGRIGAQETTATPPGTSQASVTLSSNLAGSTITIPLVGTVSAGSPSGRPVQIAVNLAPTSATLTSVRCLSGSSTAQGLTLAMDNGLLTSSISVPLRVQGSVSLAGLVGLVSVDITTNVTVSTQVSPTSTTFTITIPPQAFDTVYSTGTGDLTLGSTTAKVGTAVTATLLGLPITLSTAQLDSILNPVISSVVSPLITGVNSALVAPLTNLLGVRVGGADVIVDSTPPLSCSTPILRQ